jgi:hypothetical protein
LGGTHAFRSNLFASKQAKRISTSIVAAIKEANISNAENKKEQRKIFALFL